MAKQTFTTGQVLTAAQMTSLQQTAMLGGAASAKVASYTLVAADAGTAISMSNASATTITVNTGLFAAGDTVFIQNIGAGACTITAGTATVATAGSLILPQNDAGILYFTSTGTATFYDFIQPGSVSPLTTKGDVYTFSTSDARLGVGANATVLTADSAEATGLKWATSGGLTLITETVASANSSISFSSIPQTYKQLILVWGAINHSNSTGTFSLRLNNNSGSVYADKGSETSGTSAATNNTLTTSIRGTNTTPFGINVQGDGVYEGAVNGYCIIDNYFSTTKYKQVWMAYAYTDATAVNRFTNIISSFLSTTAVTSIDIVRLAGTATISSFTNTSIRLYGLS